MTRDEDIERSCVEKPDAWVWCDFDGGAGPCPLWAPDTPSRASLQFDRYATLGFEP